MHYPDAIYVSGGELVERHHVFWIVVFYLHEICYLAVGLLWQLAANLDIDSLVAPLSLVNAIVIAVGARSRDQLAETFKDLENVWSEYKVFEKIEN